MIKNLVGKTFHFYNSYERRIGIAFMLFGFGMDSLTLKRIDLLFENIVLLWYLLVAFTCIILINMNGSGKFRHSFLQKISYWATLPMQVVFGGLFSGFIVLYSRSGSIVGSWPFIIILILLMVGNEFAKTRYAQFAFHLTIFYTALFSYSMLIVPVIIKQMGALIFFLSGIVSLFIIVLILLLLRKVAHERWIKSKYSISISLISVFVIFNILYYTNIIPPVPLSLKAIGIYHDLRRQNNAYSASVESPPWYQFYYNTSRTFHRYKNERVYVYSAVFAPTKLSIPIYHRWLKYNKNTKKWVMNDMLSYPINGGRDGGYRGFSYKQQLVPGLWRVEVRTKRNQLLGRITFTIEDTPTKPEVKAAKL